MRTRIVSAASAADTATRIIDRRTLASDPDQGRLSDNLLDLAAHLATRRQVADGVLCDEGPDGFVIFARLRLDYERHLEAYIRGLRRVGVPWDEIADGLGQRNKQAAWDFYRRLRARVDAHRAELMPRPQPASAAEQRKDEERLARQADGLVAAAGQLAAVRAQMPGDLQDDVTRLTALAVEAARADDVDVLRELSGAIFDVVVDLTDDDLADRIGADARQVAQQVADRLKLPLWTVRGDLPPVL